MFKMILDLIWLVVAGVELAVGYMLGGVIMMITIVGIPFGIQAFKLAGFTRPHPTGGLFRPTKGEKLRRTGGGILPWCRPRSSSYTTSTAASWPPARARRRSRVRNGHSRASAKATKAAS